MESTQRWTNRKAPERKVDKELQRIKSLAVVSVLNKAFGDTEPVSRSRSVSQDEAFAIRRPLSDYNLNKVDIKPEAKLIPTEEPIIQAKYEPSKELEEAYAQNSQQQQLLLLQDALVHALSQQIDFLMAENQKLSVQNKEQVSMQEIRETLEDLRCEDWKEDMQRIQERLTVDTVALEAIEKTSQILQKETRSQTMSIEAKMETLMNQLKEKNDIVDRLHYEQQIKQMFPTKSTETTCSRQSSGSRPRSHLTRYKGGLPAASPPPSAPLPPIPADSVPNRPASAYNLNMTRPTSAFNPDLKSRPASTYDQDSTSKYASTYDQDMLSRPISIYDQETLSRPASSYNYNSLSRPVSGYDQEPLSRPVSTYEEEISEMVYYKEFTDQLQERLSMSKEIDDLSVWKPSDYDEIQRKINSDDWLEDDKKDAFWKGMKKKLRV